MELRYWNDGLGSATNATSTSVQFSVQNQAYKDCMRNNFGKTQVINKIDASISHSHGQIRWAPNKQDGTTNTTHPFICAN